MTQSTTARPAPGPKGQPILGSARAIQRDIIQTLMDGWRQFGDVVRFRVPGLSIYLVAHPDHVRHVMVDHHRNYPKVPSVDSKFKDISGEGLLNTQGEFWLRQRRLMQPAFHRR